MLTFAMVVIFFVSDFAYRSVTFANVNNIEKIVFTTDPKNLAINEVSSGITIQAQNSSASVERMDVAGGKMTITVSGGEVSSSATNWENISAPLTVNSNWSGRTVYYKNSTAGTYTISATLDISGKSWTATQNITVGGSSDGDTGGGAGSNNDDAVGNNDSASTTASSTNSTTANSSNSSGTTVAYSVHYIQEDLSDYEEQTTFEVGAGRARLSYVNSPIGFIAKHKISKNLNIKSCNYVWNFGDGVSLVGEKVEHIYKYAGDYNVVLNGTCGDLKSVTRTSVKVVSPNVLISTKVDGAIEIFNQGKYELNLYGWKVQSGGTAFIFPQDTIISAGKSVTFPLENMKLANVGNQFVLADAVGRNVAETNMNSLGLNSNQEISLEELNKFVLAYRNIPASQAVVATANQAPIMPTVSDSQNLVSVLGNEEGARVEEQATTSIPMTAAIADVVINKEVKTGFWNKLFHPVRTIREAFYK